MTFVDDGIIVAARPHGEAHAVAEVLTTTHGLWAGLVYGGQGARVQSVLQLGNGVRAEWKGRFDDSLGRFSLELETPRAAALMGDRLALKGLAALSAVAAAALPEREAVPGVHDGLAVCLDALCDPDLWPALMARWELGLLAAVGYALDLTKCAATGTTDDLVYVSPKSARAVSAAAGEPYKERLLPLPAFLAGRAREASLKEALDALETTGWFLATRCLHPANRDLPEARARAIDALRQRLRNDD
ncbi:MAG: DNA repair protein RecO [Parvularculaceae bacterium]